MQAEFFKNTPLLKTKVAAFGQGGGNIADVLAGYTTREGKRAYEVYALNSNDADLASLKNIPIPNQTSLGLGGLGKNPEKARRLFRRNKEVAGKITDFVKDLHALEDGEARDDLHLYIATLGGGTGTSTVVEAIEANYREVLYPAMMKAMTDIRAEVGDHEFMTNQEVYAQEIIEVVAENHPKLGLVLVTPPTHEGADVLRQSFNTLSEIWKLASDARYGISFVNVPDNEYFFNAFNELGVDVRGKFKSQNGWANQQIAELFHGALAACGNPESSVMLDSGDLKRLFLEGSGALTFSHSNVDVNENTTDSDIVKQCKALLGKNRLQSDFPLITTDEHGNDVAHKSTNLGVICVVDDVAKGVAGDTTMNNILSELGKGVKTVGAVLSGFLKTSNNFQSTAYIILKFASLPPHVEQLIKEHNATVEEAKAVQAITTRIGTVDRTTNFNEDLLNDLFGGLKNPTPVAFAPVAEGVEGTSANPAEEVEAKVFTQEELNAQFAAMFPAK